MAQKILVTGSSGFIGRSMTSYLRSLGNDVIELDMKAATPSLSSAEFFQCDLLERDRLIALVKNIAPSVVVHLAARTDLDESEGIEGYAANTTGTQNLVDAVIASRTVKRVLFTSSQLVCRVGYIPQSDIDYQPVNYYGQSKVISEQIVRKSMPESIDWCILRPTTIWGEGMSPHYQRFLRLLAHGRYFHAGAAPLYKSYGYVGNAVFQYSKCVSAPAKAISGRTFYIADYSPISLREWIDSLSIGLAGRKVRTIPIEAAKILAMGGDFLNMIGFTRFPFNSFRLNNILTEYRFDMTPTELVCGPLPYSMQSGIDRTVQWFGRVQADAATAR